MRNVFRPALTRRWLATATLFGWVAACGTGSESGPSGAAAGTGNRPGDSAGATNLAGAVGAIAGAPALGGAGADAGAGFSGMASVAGAAGASGSPIVAAAGSQAAAGSSGAVGAAGSSGSLGNTGGIFASATFKLGRIPGVDRGCIAAVIPRQENEFVLLDAGANIECKPLHLAQFAVMGSVYSREVLGRKEPRVGILSIGTEDSKGNELTLEAFKLCKRLGLNFIGNVEGHDLFKDHVDVVVCDGFVGNIVLKTCESLAVGMLSMIKRELMRNPKRQIGAYLAKNAFHAIRRRMDPEVYGGAPLLGFNGMVFKAHGSSRERAIASALRVTAGAVQQRLNETIVREIARANERLAAAQTAAPASASA